MVYHHGGAHRVRSRPQPA